MPKLWAKSLGERGHKVRIYEARAGGNLMRSVYLHGKEDRRTLGHRDKHKAIADGFALLASFRPMGMRSTGYPHPRRADPPVQRARLCGEESTRDGDATACPRAAVFGADLDVGTLGLGRDPLRTGQAERRFHPTRGSR
jgi:hypothetical protein